MKVFIYRLAIALTVIGLGACSVNPVTGENELSLMSAQQEVALGQQNYGPAQQMQGGRYVVDPDLSVYVNNVGQKLARASHRPNLPYEFVVLNNDVPNAWAMPGGKIAINRGLLVLLEDESQLAAVLGHEVVHAAARHSAQQQTQNTLLGVGVMAAGLAVSSKDPELGALTMGALGVGAQAWQARYGRTQELQADEYGIQ
ncbi:MAG TPA: M48 family metalloprotease, partial [Cellvibrionaceae bacterium]